MGLLEVCGVLCLSGIDWRRAGGKKDTGVCSRLSCVWVFRFSVCGYMVPRPLLPSRWQRKMDLGSTGVPLLPETEPGSLLRLFELFFRYSLK